MRILLAALLFLAPVAAEARTTESALAAILAEAGPGTRWGVVVADAEGREIVAINPEGRFVPASNTKIFTTAAALRAYHRAAGTLASDAGAQVRLDARRDAKAPDVVLVGRGDTRLSGAPVCARQCLRSLADAVAARTRRVNNVVGDDTRFPDQRWSPGMSWNNIPASSGTGVSALSIDDNEIVATVTPGALGEPPVITIPSYYTVRNLARTVAGDIDGLAYDRAPNSRTLVVSGTIGATRTPVVWRLGIDNPAHYAAWQLAGQLRARGVRVTGEVDTRHRPLLASGTQPRVAPVPPALATIDAGTLSQDIVTINKQSQNLYAEVLLRRLGLENGTGSIADGQAVVRAMLDEAGVPAAQASLADGSGMSSYNRVAPRGMVKLLGWIARQSWASEFRASLPIGAFDGTLRNRFSGTDLAGRIFAKTGSLNGTSALAGWLTAASGRTLTFAIFANDVPDGVAATAIMDRALVALAAAN